MTGLDHTAVIPGYWPSAWPAECGGPRRQKVAAGPGLGLLPGEVLAVTTRATGRWPVMFVQRDMGDLYLQGGAAYDPAEGAPFYRGRGTAPGWLERVDPVSLEMVSRSPDLPSGGWVWCGAVVAHENGDLYVVNGRYCHRLNPACELVAKRELPIDGPYNGLLVMSDGNLVTRNLGFRAEDVATFSVLDPDLDLQGDPLTVAERCMGRFSSDRSADGEFIYATTDQGVYRLRYEGGQLTVDRSWRPSYAVENGQSDAWDTTIGSDSVWLMDMGRPRSWSKPGTARQRAFRFSIDDPNQRDIIDVVGAPGAWNPGPPLFDPVRSILVHYDSENARVVAHRYGGPGTLEKLWDRPYLNYVQMLVFAESGELVLEDASASSVVVVDIETGQERGRARIGAPTIGMFLCPGFGRDFYVATLPGEVARVFVQGLH